MNTTLLWTAVFIQGSLLAALILLMQFKKYLTAMSEATKKLQQAQNTLDKSQLKLDLFIEKLHKKDD